MEIYIKGYNLQLPDRFEQEIISTIHNATCYFGNLSNPINSPYYPARSDAKIMRDDVISSVIIVSEMLEKHNIVDARTKIPLIVANGVFMVYGEKYMNLVSKIAENISTEENNIDMVINEGFRFTPPLMALETLTNATMSFIAQYTGLKSHNTTFGNSSIASFYALQESEYLSLSQIPIVLVSSNNASVFSFSTNSSALGYGEGWKESSASACLLVAGEKSGALAKITQLKSGTEIPNLYKTEITRNWKQLLPDSSADLLLFSGAYDEKTYQEDLEYCQTINQNAESLFNKYGNMGSSNLFVSIIYAIEKLSDQVRVIDIVDRDIYNRESFVRVEVC